MRWGWCAHIIHGLLLISIIATSANGCPFLRRSPVSQDAYKTATSRELLAATEIPATKFTKLEQATVDSVYEEIIALVESNGGGGSTYNERRGRYDPPPTGFDDNSAQARARADVVAGAVQLAFHDAGSFDSSNSSWYGGPDGCACPNNQDNAGLVWIKGLLKPIWRKKYMDLMSLADFYALSAKVAVEISRFSSGTTLTIPFRWGRIDADECTLDTDLCDVVTSQHRLPSSIKSLDHIKEVFIDRMGFNERQIVALMGAHSIGKLEKANSGYLGVWETSATPSVMDVSYYRGILTVPWNRRTVDLTDSEYTGEETEKYEWVQPAFTTENQRNAILLNTDMCLAWKIGDGDDEVNAGKTDAAKCVSRCVQSEYFVSKKGDESCTGDTTVEGSAVNGGSLGPTKGTTGACFKQDDPWRMWVEKFAMDEQTWYDAFAPAFQKMSELGYSSEGGVKGFLYEIGETPSDLIQDPDRWEEKADLA